MTAHDRWSTVFCWLDSESISFSMSFKTGLLMLYSKIKKENSFYNLIEDIFLKKQQMLPVKSFIKSAQVVSALSPLT